MNRVNRFTNFTRNFFVSPNVQYAMQKKILDKITKKK